MSAYMVDREHVHFLVEASSARALFARIQGSSLSWRGADGEWRYMRAGDYEEASRVGQMLWDENRKSINARYPDTVGHMENAPGPIGETFIYGEHGPAAFATIDPEQVIMACRCYAYQSCEHGEAWRASEAHAFISALERAATDAILDRGDWKWGAPDDWPANCLVRLPDGVS